jgi:hypothetical protein
MATNAVELLPVRVLPREELKSSLNERDHSVDDLAFDEMNLVELPFALLTRDTAGVYEIPLSADGKSRLACLNSSEHGLPNSLAPRVVLGLMWMWKSEQVDGDQTFRVGLRRLVQRYMYPERFLRYAPNGELLRAVERQINCIANSRLHTDRWWDNELRCQQTANIAIVSDVTVLDEGGRNRPRVLQVTWGQTFWESMVRRYTKPIDVRLVQSIDNPIDLQLYRLLDRQLATKTRQRYSDVVAFARYKLGMRGRTLDLGGRTASSYVAKKLSESLRRLQREQFTVVMTIDRSSDLFAVTFERVEKPQPGQPHEVREVDLPRELIRDFMFYAHNVSREERHPRGSVADRGLAREWLETYGSKKATWMVQRCVQLQRERHGQPILVFRGLRLYEGAAAGAYEQQRQRSAEKKREENVEAFDYLWNLYRKRLVELFDETVGEEEGARLEEEAFREVRSTRGDSPVFIVKALVHARVCAQKCEHMNSMTEAEFRDFASREALVEAIARRHGANMLARLHDPECAAGAMAERPY